MRDVNDLDHFSGNIVFLLHRQGIPHCKRFNQRLCVDSLTLTSLGLLFPFKLRFARVQLFDPLLNVGEHHIVRFCHSVHEGTNFSNTRLVRVFGRGRISKKGFAEMQSLLLCSQANGKHLRALHDDYGATYR